MAQATCELQWLQFLFTNFILNFSSPALLYYDNRAALHIAANHVFHERTKHIELDCHFICEKIQVRLIKTAHVSTIKQITDIFTKPLAYQQFDYLLGKLGMIDIHAPTRGEVLANKYNNYGAHVKIQ